MNNRGRHSRNRRFIPGIPVAAISIALLAAVTLLPAGTAAKTDKPLHNKDYSPRKGVLGIQISKDGYPRIKASTGDTWLFSRVPKMYRRQFKNVCLYIEWRDFNPNETGDIEHRFRLRKYRKIIEDLKACGVESVGVCFCHYLPDWVIENVYDRFDAKKWKLDKWVPYCWWAAGIFKYNKTTKIISQYEKPEKWNQANKYYKTAVHLALGEYREMVKTFAEQFGRDITYWEPWDELGWGLNHAPASVEFTEFDPREGPPPWAKDVCAGVRFSGWPGPTEVAGGVPWVDGDAITVQKACYKTVHEVYTAHGWKNPCVFLASLVGDDYMVKLPKTDFKGNMGGNTSSINYYSANPRTIYNYCDAVGIHLFNPPLKSFKTDSSSQKTWTQLYKELDAELAGIKVKREIAVTSYGSPHAKFLTKSDGKKRVPVYDNYLPVENEDEHATREDQARALRSGTESLHDAGCRKFWYFKDIDDRTVTAEERYYGLFSYDAHKPFSEKNAKPNSAWWEYMYLQKTWRFR